MSVFPKIGLPFKRGYRGYAGLRVFQNSGYRFRGAQCKDAGSPWLGKLAYCFGLTVFEFAVQVFPGLGVRASGETSRILQWHAWIVLSLC